MPDAGGKKCKKCLKKYPGKEISHSRVLNVGRNGCYMLVYPSISYLQMPGSLEIFYDLNIYLCRNGSLLRRQATLIHQKHTLNFSPFLKETTDIGWITPYLCQPYRDQLTRTWVWGSNTSQHQTQHWRYGSNCEVPYIYGCGVTSTSS